MQKQICAKYLGVALLMLYLTACIKTVSEPDYPDGSIKLVVSSIISPEQPQIIVRVIRSKPFFNSGNFNQLVDNATVTISGENRSIKLEFMPISINGNVDPKQSFYAADSSAFRINPGATYTLSISTPDGLSAKAECTVPSAITLKEINLLPTVTNSTTTFFPIEITWSMGTDEILYFFTAHGLRRTSDLVGDTTRYPTFSNIGAIIHPNEQGNTVTATFFGNQYASGGITYSTQFTDIRLQIFDPNMYQGYLNAKNANANKNTLGFSIMNPVDNKFIDPLFESAGYQDIILPTNNIAPGSVYVLAGGTILVEGQDYTIDYNLGIIKIINPGIIASGVQISYKFQGTNGTTQTSDPAYFTSDSTSIPYQDNLFSEPTNYFTNVEGGLGIFGAYNMNTVEIK